MEIAAPIRSLLAARLAPCSPDGRARRASRPRSPHFESTPDPVCPVLRWETMIGLPITSARSFIRSARWVSLR
jgi:hypothetical protein